MIVGAAAFAAMREYEKHQAANGNPPSHAFAKELVAGIAAAEVMTLLCLPHNDHHVPPFSGVPTSVVVYLGG